MFVFQRACNNVKKRSEKMKGFALRFAAAVALVSVSSIANAASFDAGELLFDQPGWDYSPSAMLDIDGKEKVWWCGHNNGHDVVKYRERQGTGFWTSPRIVLESARASGAGTVLSWEGIHNCDPTVVRGHWYIGADHYSYAMYFTTERPGTSVDNRIGVAFSKDGKQWRKHPAPVIFDGQTGTYSTGQSVAWSIDGNSGVRTVYTFVDATGRIRYYYRESVDGINFGPSRELSQAGLTLNGVPGISHANPAIGFAPGIYQGSYYYFLVNVCETYDNGPYGPGHPEWGQPRAVCVYRAEGENAFTGTWTRILDSTHVKPIEVEPGFQTNLFGSLDDSLPYISVNHGCSGDGTPSTWEICWYDGKLP
jgi:hypothetical protein